MWPPNQSFEKRTQLDFEHEFSKLALSWDAFQEPSCNDYVEAFETDSRLENDQVQRELKDMAIKDSTIPHHLWKFNSNISTNGTVDRTAMSQNRVEDEEQIEREIWILDTILEQCHAIGETSCYRIRLLNSTFLMGDFEALKYNGKSLKWYAKKWAFLGGHVYVVWQEQLVLDDDVLLHKEE